MFLRWLFRQGPGTAPDDPRTVPSYLVPLSERLAALEAETRALRSTVKAVEMEFETVQDKVYRWMQRTRKRERDEAARGEAPAIDPVDPPAHVHPIIARIRARRENRGVSP
jgi:hypothetical protein